MYFYFHIYNWLLQVRKWSGQGTVRECYFGGWIFWVVIGQTLNSEGYRSPKINL